MQLVALSRLYIHVEVPRRISGSWGARSSHYFVLSLTCKTDRLRARIASSIFCGALDSKALLLDFVVLSRDGLATFQTRRGLDPKGCNRTRRGSGPKGNAWQPTGPVGRRKSTLVLSVNMNSEGKQKDKK